MSKKETSPDNDVYFLGTKESNKKRPWIIVLWVALGVFLVVGTMVISGLITMGDKALKYIHGPKSSSVNQVHNIPNNVATNDLAHGYVEVAEETVNDVPMFLYTPHYAEMSLAVGMPDEADTSIIFAAQAADVRADNKDIVGDFVLAGKQLSRGIAKAGFCAITGGKITIGIGESTPLLQEAIESNGYFFRQYPLVRNGVVMENNPKNKSIRRALAMRSGRIIMIESRSQESFHDFSQALVDIGVSDAIYLVGSTTYGWYYDSGRNRHEFGIRQGNLSGKTNYIVWRTKSIDN